MLFQYVIVCLDVGLKQEAPVDVMATMATNIFHNNVIGSQMNNDVIQKVARQTKTSVNATEHPNQPTGLVSRSNQDTIMADVANEAVQLTSGQPNATQIQQASQSQPRMERDYTLPRTRKGDIGKHSPPSLPTCNYATPPPTPLELYRRIPQKKNKNYKAEATLHNALLFLVKEGWLEPTAEDTTDHLAILSAMHPDFEATIKNVPEVMKIDFSPLLDEDENYASHTEISKETIRMMDACYVYYGGDFGLVLRYLGGEYSAEWRDVDAVVDAVRPHVSAKDLVHIKRILDACEASPFEFNWEESAENKETFIRRGNNPAVKANWPVVKKTAVKEWRNKNIMIFSRWVLRASAYGHHVPQTIIIKNGNVEKARLVWDGTTKMYALEVTMNEITSTENEPDITFGIALLGFLIWIWNLRITFPDEDIFLAFIDISSCFRYARIFADLVGAFGFMLGPWYIAANAMVFGSVASASSWEPLRRAIAGVALACFYRKGLVEKHKKMIDMITWTRESTDGVRFARATKCSHNKGIINEDGTEQPSPHHIYVDDNMMADIGRRMPNTLASALEAIYTVMGEPLLRLRQCAVALDKWLKLQVSYCLVLLGLVINTRTMTVGVTDAYRKEVTDLLVNTWHDGRQAFYVSELEKLVGKLGRLGQAYRPIYHLMPHLYASVAYALRQNHEYLTTHSRQFRKMLKRIKMEATIEQDEREINFAVKTVAKKTHAVRELYRMPPTLIEEIDIIRRILLDPSIRLESHIGHMVPRDPEIEAGADSCKRAGGGWSIDLLFWWHLVYKDEVIRRAYLPNNTKGDYISINVLEMVCVIINFAAAIHTCWVDGTNLADHPVILNWCDSTSACSWVNKKCKSSLIGRALGRLFVGLLMGTDLGIQAEWLPSELNKIADDISRLKNESGKSGNYDYSQLLIDHPSLQPCRQFQPSDTLLTMIYDILLKSASPDPLTVRKLEPRALGSLISLDF